MSDDFVIRFNYGRMVAVFETKEELDNWVIKNDLPEAYMHTIHGIGDKVLDFEKYKKTILAGKGESMAVYLNMIKLKELNPQWFAKGNKKAFGDVSYKLVYGKSTGERYLLRSTYSSMFGDGLGLKRKLVYRINFIKDSGKIGSLVDVIFTSLSSANSWLRQN